jgi:hypothetical protein
MARTGLLNKAAGITALSSVLLTKVVANTLSILFADHTTWLRVKFWWTKFNPVTINVISELPGVAVAGEIAVSNTAPGTDVVTVKGTDADLLDAVCSMWSTSSIRTCAVAGLFSKPIGTTARSCVLLSVKVSNGLSLPFNDHTARQLKGPWGVAVLDAVMVSARSALPTAVLTGEMLIVSADDPGVPGPKPGVCVEVNVELQASRPINRTRKHKEATVRCTAVSPPAANLSRNSWFNVIARIS